MAFKPKGQGIEASSLLGILNNSKIQTQNPALYQTIQGLISIAQEFKSGIANAFTKDGRLAASQIDGTIPLKNGGALSGIYLPVLTDVTNIDVSAAFYCCWTRIGNMVSVWGKCTIDVTAAATLTELRISLPFPSQFAHEEQCSGTANGVPFAASTDDFAGIVIADVANHEALIRFYSPNTEDNDVRFIFSYLFIPLNL